MSQPIPSSVILAAQASEQACGVPASVTIAQWVLESARGADMPPGSDNPFGIKARVGDPFVNVWTTEYRGGRYVRLLAPFRKFNTLGDAFACHGAMIAGDEIYKAAMAGLPGADKFANALTGVYATDPDYGGKLIEIMNGANLYQYDVAAPPAGTGPQPPSPPVDPADALNAAELRTLGG